MNFFDSLIDEVEGALSSLSCNSYSGNGADSWHDIGYNSVILQRDTACELDGVGFNLVTSRHVDDGTVIAGDDLAEIDSKRRFVRISVIETEETEDEQKLYDLIRKIEYVKYHYFPEGYMIRTASRSHKEVVRVAKTAVKNGISFKNIGDLLIGKYKEIPAVKGVKVIFITDTDAEYDRFCELAEKNNRIVKTLDHVMNNVTFDCDTCNLKAVCDEVEGMKELHFKASRR